MLAERSMNASRELDGRIAYAVRRVLCRKPTDHDLSVLRRAYHRQAAIYRANLEKAKAILSVGAETRDQSLGIAEHAALSAVCLAILNLDEALSRE
jgi:hypothetical protein